MQTNQIESTFAQLLQNQSTRDTTEPICPPLSAQSTCLLNLVEAHSVGIAFMEAVGVSERLQGRDRGQDVAQTHGLPQQPQSDQRTCPSQHLHCPLLAAALQAHPIHLWEGRRKAGMKVKLGCRQKQSVSG